MIKIYFVIILILLSSCSTKSNNHWKYDIGEKAVHGLTKDTVMVVQRFSIASGIVVIRKSNYDIIKVDERELERLTKPKHNE